jgi:hypothetical protein
MVDFDGKTGSREMIYTPLQYGVRWLDRLRFESDGIILWFSVSFWNLGAQS